MKNYIKNVCYAIYGALTIIAAVGGIIITIGLITLGAEWHIEPIKIVCEIGMTIACYFITYNIGKACWAWNYGIEDEDNIETNDNIENNELQ